MNLTITKMLTDLKQEKWTFYLTSAPFLYLDAYRFQTREDTQHSWTTNKCWLRMDNRINNIEKPVIPDNVKSELVDKICELLKNLEIQ
jgi:hypothetical protein